MEDLSKTTVEARVHCAMTGGHDWVTIPIPMAKGPLEPTLQIHYCCKKCNTMERHNMMDALIDDLDERDEMKAAFVGVENG